MSAPGGPRRRGKHSSDGTGGVPASMWTGPGAPTGGSTPPGTPAPPPRHSGDRSTGSGVLDRGDDRTGPLGEPSWWPGEGEHAFARGRHPSARLPPLPTGI